ncbi:M12 mutant protein [Culex quinquefasciatus]|uniref:M12 mutant protein n=1 Tax=Culex quinquefasciatus TaxID=7176 RepID=B0W8Y7_CULQU|nr:M12 mutant protein [Culex quinquefasciatus]|eukprot:XP_001845101.1 M12 mutant protein [Culex quinquefasciatus]
MLSETSVTKVIVHLLVLLGVVDHFKRKLLGCWRAKSVLDVSDSFAVPSDEDDKDKSVWFLDHDYLENSYGIFKKLPVNHQIVYQLQDILNLLPDLAQEDFTDAQYVKMNGKEKEKDGRDGEKEEKEKNVNLPRVTAQLEKLMGTNVVRLTDRKYMQELQRRIQQDYNVTLEKRISEREEASITKATIMADVCPVDAPFPQI